MPKLMQIRGRRICIAGSVGHEADIALVSYAHNLVTELVRVLVAQGGLICCGIGRNPRQKDRPLLPPVIFDWTILEAALQQLRDGNCEADGPQGHLIATIATHKTAAQIPGDKKAIWDQLIESSAVLLRYVEPGWTSGAVRRECEADLSDIFIAVSGSEGVEHLATEFAAQGKPVIPLDLDVGASTHGGSGSAPRLFAAMRHRPMDFVKSAQLHSLGALLARMETACGKTPVAQVVSAVLELITGLVPPDAFYVRLLNQKLPDYGAVEGYFRQIVDPVVRDFGYNPVEMGRADTTSAWMNAQIFDSIHYSAITVADLTGVRNNCFMELGYALGRERRVMITAKEGTDLPFDAGPIEAQTWSETTDDFRRIEDFRAYWKRNINRPSLVQPRRIL